MKVATITLQLIKETKNQYRFEELKTEPVMTGKQQALWNGTLYLNKELFPFVPSEITIEITDEKHTVGNTGLTPFQLNNWIDATKK